MLCNFCGAENKPTSKFCYSCGKEMTYIVELSDSVQLPRNGNTTPATKIKKSVKKYDKNKNQKLLYLGLGVLIILVVVVSYFAVQSLKGEEYTPGLKFEILCREMYKKVESRPVPAAMGDKYADFNFLNLVESYFDDAFQNNKPDAIKSAGISTADIFICRVTNGEVHEPAIDSRIIEYFDAEGRIFKQRIFLRPEEIANSMGDEKYFDREYKYYSNGLLNEIIVPSVNGSDGQMYRYFYNKNNTLSGFELMYNEVTQTTELKYNNNGIMKWVYKYSKIMGGETGGNQVYWQELLYDEKGKVKRIFPIDENKKPLEGYGYDLQYTESGVFVKSGNTKNKKVIDGSTVFYSTQRTYDSRGLIIAVRKFENNVLKTLWLYDYSGRSKR